MLEAVMRIITVIHMTRVIVTVSLGPILSVSQPKKIELMIAGICPNIKSIIISVSPMFKVPLAYIAT